MTMGRTATSLTTQFWQLSSRFHGRVRTSSGASDRCNPALNAIVGMEWSLGEEPNLAGMTNLHSLP
jgi:hypothetical protein